MAIASRKELVTTTVAIVALLGAGAVFWSNSRAGGADNPDFPDGHPYMCADCGHVMILSDSDLFDIRKKARESDSLEPGRVVCEQCDSANMQQALHCPSCGEYSPRPGRGRPICPKCNEPFPSLFEE